MEKFENIIRLYSKENKINIKYCNNDVKGIEYFQTNNESKILIDLSAMYNNMLILYENDEKVDKDNNSIVQIEKTKQKDLDISLDIEREKTKQLELEIQKIILHLKLSE